MEKPPSYENGKLTQAGFEEAKSRFLEFIDYFEKHFSPPEYYLFSLGLCAIAMMQGGDAMFPKEEKKAS